MRARGVAAVAQQLGKNHVNSAKAEVHAYGTRDSAHACPITPCYRAARLLPRFSHRANVPHARAARPGDGLPLDRAAGRMRVNIAAGRTRVNIAAGARRR